MRIEPGTYTISKQTIGASRDIDPLFPNSQLEWSTKRRNVAILVGLLVKIEEKGSEIDVGTVRQRARAETPTTQGTDIDCYVHEYGGMYHKLTHDW